MAEEASPQAAAMPPSITEPAPAPERAVADAEVKQVQDTNGVASNVAPEPSEPKGVAIPDVVDATASVESSVQPETTGSKQTISEVVTQDKPITPQEDIEMADTKEAELAAEDPAESTAADNTPASADKLKAARRKSGGVPEHKGRKLNRKASKAKITHTDAKPGDYFYIRLKGYPLWPGIVCDESMLPQSLIEHRPVTAARPDGSYRADFSEGGPRFKDRSFPVMYLHTNEFGWIPNKDLVDLDFENVGDIPASMKNKDLIAAHHLAAEQNDLVHFKKILREFQELRAAQIASEEAARAEKKAKKAASKKEKKSAKVVDDGDEDVDMTDAPGEADFEGPGMSEVAEVNKKKRKSKEQDDRDSVKKPRPSGIKLTISTPKSSKATNGTSTPKSAKEPSTKEKKPKTKKSAAKAPESPEAVVPKEPEATAEEKRAKKEKEILFLRHKLQKGLLSRDQEPKEDEMSQMSEYISKLEAYAELEVSIIRATKINKVLKAILKLPAIPKEEEFHFKPRSQTLLDKWNKLLATEQGTPAAPATNGAAAETKTEAEESKIFPTETTNGSKESPAEEKDKVEEKAEEKAEEKPEDAVASNELPAAAETAPAPPVEEPAEESMPEPTPVETSA